MILERVILVKALKNIFRMVMRESDIVCLKEILAHLLNSIFCCEPKLAGQDESEGETFNSEERFSCKDKDEGNTHTTISSNNNTSIYKKKKKKNNKDKEKDDCILDFQIPQKPNKYRGMKSGEIWEIVKKVALSRYFFKFG